LASASILQVGLFGQLGLASWDSTTTENIKLGWGTTHCKYFDGIERWAGKILLT